MPHSKPQTAMWWKSPSPSPPAGVEEPSPPWIPGLGCLLGKVGGVGMRCTVWSQERWAGIGREDLGLVPAGQPGTFIHPPAHFPRTPCLICLLFSWLLWGPSSLGFGFVFLLFWPPLALAEQTRFRSSSLPEQAHDTPKCVFVLNTSRALGEPRGTRSLPYAFSCFLIYYPTRERITLCITCGWYTDF